MVQTFVKRPTSPLRFEPLQIPPEDILWPGSDEEADGDEREKKRVRIEECGKQYLEGRPLFIQSAGLRGPFGQGWINPWASKKRALNEDTRRYNAAPQVAESGFYNQAEARNILSRVAKRSSNTDIGLGFSIDGQSAGTTVEEARNKRRRLEGTAQPMTTGPMNTGGYREPAFPNIKAKNSDVEAPLRDKQGYEKLWLKTDPKFLQSRSADDGPSSTPTPNVRPRSKPREDLVPHTKPPTAELEVHSVEHTRERVFRDNEISGHSSTHKRPALGNNEQYGPRRAKDLLKRLSSSDTSNGLQPSFGNRVRTISLSKADPITSNGYMAVKRLSQEAANRYGDEEPKLNKSSQETTAEAPQSNEKPTPSRLAPYVSDFKLKDDAASSAGLKSKRKAPTPKPSPHAAPASSNLPEFHYRYASKGMSSNPSKAMQLFVRAPQGPPSRKRSESTSSSGSSNFVKEFEAAQAKASSKSFGSSYSPSPIKERPETKSVKKNTAALRRLTFTASGEAKIADSRPSSRQGSRSSATGQPTRSPKRANSKPKQSQKDATVGRASKKSSDAILTNGPVSRESAALPEAQVVSDVLFQPPQLPSKPSTDLLETDKQSPKFVSLDDYEDSYLDLSTQAAMQKAQRSFKDDLVSPVKIEASPSPDRSPDVFKSFKAHVTPNAKGHANGANHREINRSEFEHEKEPMSTQAMADAISPFVVTTVKKRPDAIKRQADFDMSPTKARSPSCTEDLSLNLYPAESFHKPLSMSTSPSVSQQTPSPPKPTPPIPISHPKTSKPTSTLTSFSRLPNGTMTDSSIFQDGQQSQPDFHISLQQDQFSTPLATANGNGEQANGSWDLNSAIEEAGSFLGNWNVEAEARKEGSERRKKEVGVRGILSFGRGNS